MDHGNKPPQLLCHKQWISRPSPSNGCCHGLVELELVRTTDVRNITGLGS